MGEGDALVSMLPFDRHVEQAVLAMKKGAHLLKCGRRGKPKFCPFRLSTDEKYLIWYSGQEERQLRLSSVYKIIAGQKTVNFQRQYQPHREQQSISLIYYANGERSVDLICKDKTEADAWFIGLRAAISRSHSCSSVSALRNRNRGAQSCLSSPAGFIRRKHNLGLMEEKNQFSQVRSLCGSPSLSLSERCFSDGLSYSSDSFYSWESNLSHMQNVTDSTLTPDSPYIQLDDVKQWGIDYAAPEFRKKASHRFSAPTHCSTQIQKNGILKDVMIWGEEVVGGNICSVHSDSFGVQSGSNSDVLLPKLLESVTMLDVQCISLGARHAALVTKQGEVFCWGEANGGRLGNKINIDISHPKLVESLNGIAVRGVACSEYQTCALTQSAELYTWGGEPYTNQWLPHKVSGPLDGVNVFAVSCGEWHTAIVSTAGKLFTYGDGTFGVLGHGNTQNLSQPKEVESLKGLWVKSVSCGPWHTAAIAEITKDRNKLNANGGKLFTWGDGDKGRLGHADGDRKLIPTCVVQLMDHDFIQVSCGGMLTVALTSKGTVYTMGSEVYGQLGNPQANDKSITVVEGKLKHEFVKDISSGSYHVAALTLGGRVYTWGRGSNGQLGLGDTEDRNTPSFVDSLRGRQVESITCGSNLTAAICLHKSITISDQSTCRGCEMAFGFARKKHNCYNCGLLFCHACSSKKVVNTSLAPNKSKPCRVCNSCFNQLQKVKNLTKNSKPENRVVGKLLSPQTQRGFLDEKDASKSRLLSLKHSSSYEEPASCLSAATPRWGHVSCPVVFDAPQAQSKNAAAGSPLPQNQSPLRSKFTILDSMIAENDLPKSDTILNEEVQWLKAEARNLEMQCQIGSQKIEECRRKIEHSWSLAKEEAEKCKAAKDLIKALALRLHSISGKFPSVREEKSAGIAVQYQSPRTRKEPLSTETHSVEGEPHLPSLQTGTASKVKPATTESPCETPIVFSNKSRSMRMQVRGRDREKQDTAAQMEAEQTAGTSNKDSKVNEWVEQYEAGVYVTFTTLASGHKGLKRVRFSRKRFTEKGAEQWWEENQLKVYKKYGIEEYSHSNQKL
ncbi:PH, RCC1 and FYVE domains-containing protein 1-like isoform X2 [Hibiscus syriacus]|uniref:PH, RCC1 and FYVE domains-containing protein 1-like isoform X2 n=1 Tax=Hibiscus syriacus TaxID=106335 RepID=UPI001924B381|nr:PH, RCC1 and FYVE domains-containing protein 1-like isoform X2 [Hibiscus syriacus]